MKNEGINKPEGLIINEFSSNLANLINTTPLSLSLKIYLVKDVLGEMVAYNNSLMAKEMDEYKKNTGKENNS